MSTVNSYIRIVATQCSLGTWFVSGIRVDTLQKGGTEDNNNNNNNDNYYYYYYYYYEITRQRIEFRDEKLSVHNIIRDRQSM
jgi:hypothetical protein